MQEFEYEFGGPIGAFFTILILPFFTLLLTHFASIGKIDLDIFNICNVLSSQITLPILLKCMVGCLAWFLLQVLLCYVLPADLVKGAPLPHPKKQPEQRLVYRINGHLAFWVTFLLLFCAFPFFDDEGRLQFTQAPLHLLYEYYTPLALASIVWCTLLSIYLYIKSFGKGLLLAKGGNSGNVIYDFYMGRELNPRWGSFDWKEFCELRPGLMGWALLNAAFILVQKEKLGHVSGSMMLVNVFQGIYVWDALYQERAILTTMDITTDGFGFMLVFGDMAWVPFTYSLQARYLVDHDPGLGIGSLVAILGINFWGYFIFRGANSQKDAFRRDPNHETVRHLQYLQTKRGTRLLTTG